MLEFVLKTLVDKIEKTCVFWATKNIVIIIEDAQKVVIYIVMPLDHSVSY